MEDLMTQDEITFEQELARESADEQRIEDYILAQSEEDGTEYRETTFEEQYENEQFAQDGDSDNMYPSEKFEGCWEN